MLKVMLFICLIISTPLAGWLIEAVDTAGNTGKYTSITLDRNERPHISYMAWSPNTRSYNLKYANWTGSAWQIHVIDTTADTAAYYNRKTSLALDAQDYPHIGYVRSRATRTRFVKYAKWDGVNWNFQEIDTATGYGGIGMALDQSGHPHMSYTKGPLMYARHDGTRWIIQKVDSMAITWFTAIALDHRGYPHISYLSGQLKYARWDGSSWLIEPIDSDPTAGQHISIALDTADRPQVSYLYQYSPTWLGLRCARRTDTGWIIEDIDLSDFGLDGATATAIKLNQAGFACITYYNGPGRTNKYAYWDGSRWITEAVFPQGLYSSLTLNRSDQPRIACYDYQLADLIYAKWVASIKEEKNLSNLNTPAFCIFPNPVQSILSIRFYKPPQSQARLCLYNISGRKVKEMVSDRKHTILLNMKDLPSAVYFLKIETEKKTVTEKIVVIK